MQHMAQQLTSLSMAVRSTTAEAQWQANADMLAALAQLSELRHLDVGNCLFLPADGARPDLHNMPSPSRCVSSGRILTRCFTTDIERHIESSATYVPIVMYAGSATCTQLSTLCKLTSVTAGRRPTQRLQAMKPAFPVLKRLQCHVRCLHADGLGAPPVPRRLTALEELHMAGNVAGDYQLLFPPSLQVHKHASMLIYANVPTKLSSVPAGRVHAADFAASA